MSELNVFTPALPGILPEWVIFHVPHDSTVIPAEVRNQFALDDAQLEAEIIRMTDHLTYYLLADGVPDHQVIRSPVSRLVVDVERFVEDALEPMSACGMGVVYEQTSAGLLLRHPLTQYDRKLLIDRWYHPHHDKLVEAVQATLDQYGKALLIDAHSFPSMPLPYEHDQRQDRPQICIGSDRFHTPEILQKSCMHAFKSAGLATQLNTPFAGALVPMRFYQTDRRVSSVMVEVNRGLYLDEKTGKATTEFDRVARLIRLCLHAAIATWQSSVWL